MKKTHDPDQTALFDRGEEEIALDSLISIARLCIDDKPLVTAAKSPLPHAEKKLLENMLKVLSCVTKHRAREAVVLFIIHQKRLYRATHDTFEAFYLDLYQHSRSNAYAVLTQARLVISLAAATGFDCFPNGLQATELKGLGVSEAQAREIWAAGTAVEKPVGRRAFDAAVGMVIGPEVLASLQAKRNQKEGSSDKSHAVTLSLSNDFSKEVDAVAAERQMTRAAYAQMALRNQVAFDQSHPQPGD